MSQNNKYLQNVIPNLYRREVLHVMIFTFIDTYKFVHPSVTLEEAAQAFMKRHKVNEDEYGMNTIVHTYLRVQKDLHDSERFYNEQKKKASKHQG